MSVSIHSLCTPFRLPSSAWLALLLSLSPGLHASGPLSSLQAVWQLENNLNESNGGSALTTTLITPSYLGDQIEGNPATVLNLPALLPTQRLTMPNGVGGNGGSAQGKTNDWTIVMDVCFPALSSDAALLQTDSANANDAEVHVLGSAGVSYEYYETGPITQLPDFDSLTPTQTGTVANFDISPRSQNNEFAFRFRGRIRIPTAGTYTFYTTSDDGSQLFINGSLVVDNDFEHASAEESGSISLDEGTHDIEVTFFENSGVESLTVEYEGPGLTRQVIPDSVLTHGDAGTLCLAATHFSNPAAVQLGKWHRIAITCEASGASLTCKTYVDGSQTSDDDNPPPPTLPLDGDLALGALLHLFSDDNSETQACKLNSVAYWGCPLSAAQIAALGAPKGLGLPDLYVVNTASVGPGSLRTAIADVRSGGTISWDLSSAGQTLTLNTGGVLQISGKTLRIDGSHLSSPLTINGNSSHRAFDIVSGADVALCGLHITNGFSGAGGGGIHNDATLLIDRCTITGCIAANGGGVANDDSATLTIRDTTISGNTAGGGGGVTNAGTLLMERCTVNNNQASTAGGVEDILSTTMINCTVVQNTATDGGGGGCATLGTLTLINCTVTGNSATDSDPVFQEGGGGVYLDFVANFNLENSIVAGNTSSVSGQDNIGGFASPNFTGNNLTSGNPTLGSLADNGGHTQTMLPLAGSPAAGVGVPTASTPATDQRGLARIQNGLDIGAAETDLAVGALLFGTWAILNIPQGQDRTFLGDPEEDSITNGNEYAFRLDPQLYDLLGLPLAEGIPNGNGFSLRIVIPYRRTATDLLYILEESTNLTSWSEVYRYDVAAGSETITDSNLATSVDVGAETITITNPVINPFSTYWRVRIQVVP